MKERVKNPLAVALGKLAAGKPKHFSANEIVRRRARMIAMNELRAKVKQKNCSVSG